MQIFFQKEVSLKLYHEINLIDDARIKNKNKNKTESRVHGLLPETCFCGLYLYVCAWGCEVKAHSLTVRGGSHCEHNAWCYETVSLFTGSGCPLMAERDSTVTVCDRKEM